MAAPTSDVEVTGWSSSAGGGVYTPVDETVADDGDYASSAWPPNRLTYGIPSQAAGTYLGKVRVNPPVAATMIVRLRDSGGVTLGSSSQVSLTASAYATYQPTITIASAATQMAIDIWPTDGAVAPDGVEPGAIE